MSRPAFPHREVSRGPSWKPGLVAPLTAVERRYIERVVAACGGRRCFRVKRCYKNAQLLITHDDAKRLRYWEGYLDDSIPHAWVTINGKIVDLTQEAIMRQRRKAGYVQGDGRPEYRGTVIDRRTLARHIIKTGYYDAVTKGRAVPE